MTGKELPIVPLGRRSSRARPLGPTLHKHSALRYPADLVDLNSPSAFFNYSILVVDQLTHQTDTRGRGKARARVAAQEASRMQRTVFPKSSGSRPGGLPRPGRSR